MGVEALIEQLKTIPDWRRGGRTVQHPLWLMLLMCLLAVMSGYSSLRGWEDFMKRHQHEVSELFGFTKAKLPGYSTLREMAQRVDANQVCNIFQIWAQQTWVLAPEAVLSIDGKALASTVSDCHGQKQDFVMLVSACVQRCDGVLAQVSFQNGQSSEIASVRQLLDQLNVTGVWVTLDALHTQKNG